MSLKDEFAKEKKFLEELQNTETKLMEENRKKFIDFLGELPEGVDMTLHNTTSPNFLCIFIEYKERNTTVKFDKENVIFENVHYRGSQWNDVVSLIAKTLVKF
jgi:hypothetical protein